MQSQKDKRTAFQVKSRVNQSKTFIVDSQLSDSGFKVTEVFGLGLGLGQRGEDVELKEQRRWVKCVPGECLRCHNDSETSR